MGLESAIVDIPERWRPWLDNGLTHLLGPLCWEESCGEVQRTENVGGFATAGTQGVSGLSGSVISGSQTFGKSLPDVVSASAEAARSKQPIHASPSLQGLAPMPPATESTQPLPADRPAGPPQRPLPTPDWPEAWKSAWSKTGFARPFLWTYEQLGEDLLGTPAPERRETLRRLLAALNFGPVHNFWPFSEPDGRGGLRLQAGLFQEALTHLAPKCVIFLGDKEIAGVTAPGTPELFKVISYLDTGVLCVHLPDIHDLAVKPALLAEVTSMFQQKLAHLI